MFQPVANTWYLRTCPACNRRDRLRINHLGIKYLIQCKNCGYTWKNQTP